MFFIPATNDICGVESTPNWKMSDVPWYLDPATYETKVTAIVCFEQPDTHHIYRRSEWELDSTGLYESPEELLEGVRGFFTHVRVTQYDLDGLKTVSEEGHPDDEHFMTFEVVDAALAGDIEDMFDRLVALQAGEYGCRTTYQVVAYGRPKSLKRARSPSPAEGQKRAHLFEE